MKKIIYRLVYPNLFLCKCTTNKDETIIQWKKFEWVVQLLNYKGKE